VTEGKGLRYTRFATVTKWPALRLTSQSVGKWIDCVRILGLFECEVYIL